MRIASTAKVDLRVVAGLLATVIVAGRRTPAVEDPTSADLQVAVLRNGFAVMDDRLATERYVVAVDRDGATPKRRAIPIVATEARLLGTPQGVAIGWLARAKVSIARVNAEGQLGTITEWGKRVKQLCRGSVRDERQYGMGWLETDGRVWIVHGALKQDREMTESEMMAMTPMTAADDATSTTRTTWCAVTGAGKHALLVWSDQHNRVDMSVCGKGGCTMSSHVPVAKTSRLEAIACHDERCTMVARDAKGNAALGWFELPYGKLRWSKPLDDAARGTSFSLTAAGPNAFAVGYVTREGAMAARVIESGSLVRAWADPASHQAPELAWSSGRLLVAHRHEGGIAPEVVPMPR